MERWGRELGFSPAGVNQVSKRLFVEVSTSRRAVVGRAAIHMLCASTLASLAAPQQLLLIRHGVTNMNVYLSKNPYGQRGFYDPGDYDTRLTDDGREMAAALNPILTEDHARAPIELLVSSPLSRALQAASLAMD